MRVCKRVLQVKWRCDGCLPGQAGDTLLHYRGTSGEVEDAL